MIKLFVLLVSAGALTLAQDDCKDKFPIYCSSWTNYCPRMQVVREQWCRKSCNTCSDEVCSPHSLSDSNLQAFQTNSIDFALELYNRARQEDSTGNIIFSPASISIALGMVLAGARGNTRDEIKHKLINDLEDQQISSAYGWLMRELNPEQSLYQLYTANAMYVQQDMWLAESFSQTVTECFNSTAEQRDFTADPNAVRLEVNEWVQQMTNDRITDLLGEDTVSDDTRMLLVNAIYFKAEWLTPFITEGHQSALTLKGPFYPLADPENPKQIDFMTKQMPLNFYEDQDLKVLELPYKDNELSMYIFLPANRTGLPALESNLTTQTINGLIGSLKKTWVGIGLPKWTLTQKLPLKKILQNMGITDLFNSNADLGGITGGRDLYVNDAIHKAFISVNERGTEASAATVIAAPELSAYESRSFTADHPFLFLIKHKSSENILFLGSLTDPQ